MGGCERTGYWPRECLEYNKHEETFRKHVKKGRKGEKEKNNFPFWNSQMEVQGSEKSLLISVQGDYTMKSKQVSESKTHSCFF